MDWNVVVTVRRDFPRAIALLRELGTIERTRLYNVLVMRVPDVRALLEHIAQRPADEHFFDTISHVVPVTNKLWFETADELAQKVQQAALAFAPQLAGASVLVRLRRRGRTPALHAHEIERRIANALLDELARRGTPGRLELHDPDAVIAIEAMRDEAGLALWTRADLDRYPFLRTSILGHGHAAAPVPVVAPSRALLATATTVATHARARHDRAATSEEILELLGELEPLTLERLVATGATIGEVAEAVAAIEDEDAFGEIEHPPSSAREAEVRAILEDLVFEDFEEREAEREIART